MNIVIQPATDKHFADIITIYNHYILTSAATFDCTAHTLEQRQDWFNQFTTEGRYQLLVALDPNKKLLGYACSTPFNERPAYDSSVNLGYYCDPKVLGLGIGSQLLSHLLGVLCKANIHKFYAGITLPNEASIQLAKKYGFKIEATFKEVGYKFNQFWDVSWLSRLNPDPSG